MRFEDRYGNSLSCTMGIARDYYITGVDCLLSANYGAIEAFEMAVQSDPQFALGFVGLARAHMNEGDMASGKATLKSAVALVADVSDREKSHIEIMDVLAAGNAAKARRLAERHITDHPRDALIAQLPTGVFGLIAFSGCNATEAQFRAHSARLLPQYGDDWWIKTVHATSMCETGQPEQGLELMEEALALNPRNANAAHFKAHTLYEMGHADEGLDYLVHWMTEYDRRAVLHGHLSWHVALWTLAKGDTQAMWAAYDQDIVPEVSQSLPINILTDCASLLYRAQLAGHEVRADRWSHLSAYAARNFPNPGQSFADIHSALCHAMAGEGDLLAKFVENPKGYAGDIVAPVAKVWSAMVRQDWQDALDLVTPVMGQHARFGGSRAQRDLLELTYLNILMKLGKKDEAKRAVSTRRPLFSKNAPIAESFS